MKTSALDKHRELMALIGIAVPQAFWACPFPWPVPHIAFEFCYLKCRIRPNSAGKWDMLVQLVVVINMCQQRSTMKIM